MDKNKPDYIFAGSAFILAVLGIVVLAGATAPFSVKNFGSPSSLLVHQLLYGLIPGIAVAIVAFNIPLVFLKKYAPVLLLINILLLILVLVPGVGLSANTGALRWISLGPLTFQPSEALKLTFLLYLAAWASSRLGVRRERFRSFAESVWEGGLAPFLLISVLIGALLLLQPDMSTLGVIILAALAVYFVANTPLWHTFSFVALGAVAFAALIIAAPYRLERVLVFFNGAADSTGVGYQLKQALIAVGSGGLAGEGLGMNYQQIRFLPAAASDSVFAIFANETGFVGASLLVLLFLVFLWRGITIAKNAPDPFSAYLALGIVSWIMAQAFINIGSMLGLVPLTGIPLPFISYGGSHLIAELAGIGLLLNISRHTS